MGRKEIPVDRTLKYNAQLALFLRRRRALSSCSYAELAEHCAYSRHTLQRAAAGGATVPPWPVVASFVRGVAEALADEEHPDETQKAMERAKSLWRKARYESRQKTQRPRPEPPLLAFVRDEADVSAVLIELYERAGAPSMETMEKQAGGMGRLPHSTAHRIISRKALPSSYDQFSAFLDACEVRPAKRDPWYRMWDRVFGSSSVLQQPSLPIRSAVPDPKSQRETGVFRLSGHGAFQIVRERGRVTVWDMRNGTQVA
ncbi:helix-turn-helix transcriptional regulator [Streptomyces sp. BPTC-684]|uniref:helix-turn-helix domain-containing protein n=1 Tax=Streptomyces sp. BPTC-684 TaxID=3043734 RepID=UPI0024B16718|nr:helix-turn-helix transcriptional regulator [Streptomyces sp. BPTC-684]WHM41115.1 helix-turn-helix transcriptional regulator [Streptomyces sp. BPTC-684]